MRITTFINVTEREYMASKIKLLVCRSCIRDNPQSDSLFASVENAKQVYGKKLRRNFFGTHAELKWVDCLTNCHRPNSVQIETLSGEEILFAEISSNNKMDEVIEMVKKFSKSSEPVTVPASLQENLRWIHNPERKH